MPDTKNKQRDFEEIFLNNDARKGTAKILWQMISDQKLKIVLTVVFHLLLSLPIWVIPIATQNIIDAATNPSERTVQIILINLAAASVAILQNIFTSTLSNKYLSMIVRNAEARLRETLVGKLLQLSADFHKDYKSGKIQSKILRDVESIQGLLEMIGSGLFHAVITAVVSITIVLYRNLTVGLIFIVIIPLVAVLIRLFNKRIKKTTGELRREIEAMSADVSEMIEMIPVSKSHGLNKIEQNRISKQLRKLCAKGQTVDVTWACFDACLWVSVNLPQIFCLAFTSILAFRGRITIGDVVMYQAFFAQILYNAFGLMKMYPQIMKGKESVVSVAEILSSKDVEDNSGKKEIKSLNGEYVFENVNFAYSGAPDKAVLNNFSLNVKKGECVAFVGESGAGKTTILNLIIGINHPQSGKIYVDGNDLKDINLIKYRSGISVVLQDTVLFSGSIRDNITYGLSGISDERLQKVIDLSNLRELIDSLPKGVDTLIGEHGGKLSGGQRQRIAIARAMIRNPDVVILDEATSALDTISEAKVQKAMNHLIKDKTTFIVAHRFSTIRKADKIVVMQEGCVQETGTYEELMNNRGIFYNMEAYADIEAG